MDLIQNNVLQDGGKLTNLPTISSGPTGTGTKYLDDQGNYTEPTDVGGVWGQITGTLSNQTDLQNALDAKLNVSSYTAADVKTKYESNADTNAFTDAEKALLGNQSGTNTGDQDLSGLMVKASNLSDVADQQTALNNVTAVSAATNEYVLTKDTTTGDAIWKASAGAVSSVFGRTGVVTAQSNDYTWAQIDKTISDIADLTTKSHTSLTDIGTNTHAQIDTHIAAANPHSGSASSGANSDITSISGLTTALSISQGGTGQTTQQAAIDAITNVAVATNEYVLTKDTASGNAIWKAAAGGSFSWGATATSTSGVGLTLTTGASASSGTIAQKIVADNTQTNGQTLLDLDIGTSNPGTPHISVRLNSNLTPLLVGGPRDLEIRGYSSATQALADGVSISIGNNFNTNSSNSWSFININNSQNAGTGLNTGINVTNLSTDFTSGSGSGIKVFQSGVNGTAMAIATASNVNSSTNGLFNITLDNTQSGASVMQKIDMGTSAQAHVGTEYQGSTSSRVWNIGTNLTQASGTATGTTTVEIKMQINGVDYVVDAKSQA